MKYLLFTIALIFTCMSCDKIKTRYSRSYVLSYYDYQDIELYAKSQYPEYIIKIKLIPGKNIGSILSKGQQKEAFDRLCEKHGDTGYNRVVRFHALPNNYLAYNITSVKVTSDSAYDELHPANTDLSDLFEFFTLSPLKYIRSGYTELYNWRYCTLTEYEMSLYGTVGSPVDSYSEFHVTRKDLSALEESDLELVGDGGHSLIFLKLLKLPTLSHENTFTVSITIENGRVFSDNVKISFLNTDE